MKKSTMIAAVFAASAFSAFAVDVYSSNIVGYTKVTLGNQLTMAGANFQDVGSTTMEIDINSIVPDTSTTGIDWENDMLFGASLLVWNGTGYDGGIYYWTGEVPSETQTFIKGELGLDPGFVYNNIWVDGDYMPANVAFPAGTAFWIQDVNRSSSSTASLSISGEVGTTGTADAIPATAILTMFANTTPVALDINDLVLTDIAGIDWENDMLFGASLLVWNGTGYDGGIYYWTGEVPSETQTFIKGELGLDPGFVYNNIWVDGDYMPADVTLPVGGAFWIQNTAAVGTSTVAFPGL